MLKQYIRELGRKQKVQKELVLRLETRLINSAYIAKAPPEVIEQTKKQLLEAQVILETIEQEYKRYVPPETVKPTQPTGEHPMPSPQQ